MKILSQMGFLKQFLKKLSWFVIKTERCVASVSDFMYPAILKTCIASVKNMWNWHNSEKLSCRKNITSWTKKIGRWISNVTLEIYPFSPYSTPKCVTLEIHVPLSRWTYRFDLWRLYSSGVIQIFCRLTRCNVILIWKCV